MTTNHHSSKSIGTAERFCALGLGPLEAVQLAWRRHQLAPIATLVVGVALLIWMAVEIAIVGYSNNPPLRPFYLLLGALITGVGLGWRITLGPSAPEEPPKRAQLRMRALQEHRQRLD